MKKMSFFEKLTGGQQYDEAEDIVDEVLDEAEDIVPKTDSDLDEEIADIEPEGDGQLTVDVYQTPDDIIIESFVAGVKPEDLDISITREMVTIRGTRHSNTSIQDDQHFYQELYWGSFSRRILLPQEVEADQSDALIKNGLLTIVLPKAHKDKVHKVRVKTS